MKKKLTLLFVVVLMASLVMAVSAFASGKDAGTQGTVDLIFLSSPTSCYCDGMHLSWTTPPTVTGNRTGCAAEPFIFGTFTPAGVPIPPSGSVGAAVVFNIGSNILTKLSFTDRQWAHYFLPYAPGDPPLNSGSFAWGATCPFAPEGAAGSSLGN